MRLLFALSISMVLRPALALADDATEGRFFDELAREAYARRDFDTAMEYFLLSQEVAPSPRTFYNVAVCAELAEHPTEAFAFLEASLSSAGLDPARAEDAKQRRARLARTLGLIRVRSDPPGASIFIDDTDRGTHGTAPQTIAVVPGAHRVILSLADHRSSTRSMTVKAGAEVEVALSLAPITGTLDVVTEPAVGTLILTAQGGEQIAESATERRFVLPVGRYWIRFAAPGHRLAETEVVVREDRSSSARLAALRLSAPVGRLLVSSDVEAAVWIDEVEVGRTPLTVHDVQIGPHTVAVVAPSGWWKREVRVTEDETTYVNATLGK